jgi:YD repeat-containing protein
MVHIEPNNLLHKIMTITPAISLEYSICLRDTSFPLADANGEQKSAKLKPKAMGDHDFEAVQKHGARSQRHRSGNRYCVSFIDNAGNVQAHYTYDAFGNTVSQTGAMVADFPFRFSSKYLDLENIVKACEGGGPAPMYCRVASQKQFLTDADRSSPAMQSPSDSARRSPRHCFTSTAPPRLCRAVWRRPAAQFSAPGRRARP